MLRPPPSSTLFPYTTLFRSHNLQNEAIVSKSLRNQIALAVVKLFGAIQRLGCYAVEPNPEQMARSEEHTSELQSRGHLVCRLLLEKKKKKTKNNNRKS